MAASDPLAYLPPKYIIHEETKKFAKMYVLSFSKPYSELGVEGSRNFALGISVALSGDEFFKGEVIELVIPSPHCPEGIPVSAYKPASCPKDAPILIFFHGGIMIVCSRKTHEVIAKNIAYKAKIIVVNVEFRNLPNLKEPCAPFNDADTVTRYILANKEKVGGSPNSKIGVGGDSTGGQLAIGVTNEIHVLDFQVLIYPLCCTELQQSSVKEFEKVPGLDGGTLNYFVNIGIAQIPDYKTNPRINPMKRTNTASSPPALIILAELDPLYGCGKEYAEKLTAAGVKVELHVLKGTPHGSVALRKIFHTVSEMVYDFVAEFMKKFR